MKENQKLFFYQYFFSNVSQQKDIKLDYFFVPGSKLHKRSFIQGQLDKTISKEFAQWVLLSD